MKIVEHYGKKIKTNYNQVWEYPICNDWKDGYIYHKIGWIKEEGEQYIHQESLKEFFDRLAKDYNYISIKRATTSIRGHYVYYALCKNIKIK